MLALMMAGGHGKRLRPLTDKVPKPMVKVGGKPLIYWQIKYLESFGVDRFVLLAGYRGGQLRDYIRSIGYGDCFDFSIEKTPLGTAGAIKNAQRFLEGEESFYVSNADNVTNQDIRRLRLRGKYKICISVAPYRSSKGIVRFSGSTVVRFDEKPIIKGCWFNAGAALIDSDVIDMLPKKGSLEQEIYPKLAKNGALACTKFENEYFNSVDSMKDKEQVDGDFRSGKIKFNF